MSRKLLFALIMNLFVGFGASAYGPDSLVLMKAQEIQSLPADDREEYLRGIRAILAKGPDVFLLDEFNVCPTGQRACAAALYGADLCIPKLAADEAVACEKAALKKPGYRQQRWLIEPGGDLLWTAYEQRVSNYCQGSEGRGLCRELHDKRVEIFMNRRTH